MPLRYCLLLFAFAFFPISSVFAADAGVPAPGENAPCLIEAHALLKAHNPTAYAEALDCMFKTLVDVDRRLRRLEQRADQPTTAAAAKQPAASGKAGQ